MTYIGLKTKVHLYVNGHIRYTENSLHKKECKAPSNFPFYLPLSLQFFLATKFLQETRSSFSLSVTEHEPKYCCTFFSTLPWNKDFKGLPCCTSDNMKTRTKKYGNYQLNK